MNFLNFEQQIYNSNVIKNKNSRNNYVKISIKTAFYLKVICFLFAAIIFPHTVLSQEADSATIRKQKTMQIIKNGEGREFFVCFMMNFHEEGQSNAKPLDLQLFITSDFDTKVTIEFPKGDYKQEVSIKAGEIVGVRLDRYAQATLFEMEDVGQAIHIVAEKPISVYGLNRRRQTTDSFLAFPVEVLGDEYMIMSYFSFSQDMQSTFAIIATEDNTVVEITPSVTTSQGRPAGKPFTVTLNKGNMYQVGSKNTSYSNIRASDLTGSHIKANKKIAVFGGHQCATVPSPAITACNVLVEQIPPLSTWGKNFYIGAFKSRSYYTYRVLASQDSTKVFEDTSLVKILNKGEFFQRDSRRNIQIVANKPVLVAQYSQGSGNGDNVGDPMMILISPVQQYLQKYRFATPVNGEWLHFVNVFVPTSAINSFKINEKPADIAGFERFGSTKYSIASIRLPYGSHTVECNQPFGLYSYGFGIQKIGNSMGPDAYDAYGAMGGQSFVDYEPVPDTIPPQAEAITQNRKKSILVSDDGRDDIGLSDVFIVKQENMDIQLPKFTQGSPSILLGYQPINQSATASFIIHAKDVAGNDAFYTVCYVFDNTTNEFITVVNKGENNECLATNTFVLGAFFSHSYNYYNANFTKTDNIEGNNKFMGITGTSGLFGISLSRYIFSSFNLTAKLTFVTNEAVFSSFDTVRNFVYDSQSQNFVPYLEGKEIKLKNYGLNADIGLDWKVSDYFYLSGGLTVGWNFSKKAEINEKLFFPPGYEFKDGGDTKFIADKLNSLSTLNLGAYIGPGLICNIGRGFQTFIDLNYYFFPFSLLNDADLFQDQVNIKVGFKYQLPG